MQDIKTMVILYGCKRVLRFLPVNFLVDYGAANNLLSQTYRYNLFQADPALIFMCAGG